VGTVRLRVVTRTRPLDRCHAAATHTPVLSRAPHHWPEPPHVANRLRAHAVSLVGNEGRTKLPRRAARPIKPPSFFSLHAPACSLCPPPSAISAAGELPPPLVPVTHQQLQATDNSKLLPSLYSSPHSHTWPSSAPHFVGTHAIAEAPPLPHHRPSPGAALAEPPTLINPMWAKSTTPSFVCIPWPHLAAGELAPTVDGTGVKPSFPRDPCASLEGLVVNIQNFPAACVELDS
jgi:hypothetical protein